MPPLSASFILVDPLWFLYGENGREFIIHACKHRTATGWLYYTYQEDMTPREAVFLLTVLYLIHGTPHTANTSVAPREFSFTRHAQSFDCTHTPRSATAGLGGSLSLQPILRVVLQISSGGLYGASACNKQKETVKCWDSAWVVCGLTHLQHNLFEFGLANISSFFFSQSDDIIGSPRLLLPRPMSA